MYSALLNPSSPLSLVQDGQSNVKTATTINKVNSINTNIELSSFGDCFTDLEQSTKSHETLEEWQTYPCKP